MDNCQLITILMLIYFYVSCMCNDNIYIYIYIYYTLSVTDGELLIKASLSALF